MIPLLQDLGWSMSFCIRNGAQFIDANPSVYPESTGRTRCIHLVYVDIYFPPLGIPPTSLEMHPVHPMPCLPTLADVLGIEEHLSKDLKCLHWDN